MNKKDIILLAFIGRISAIQLKSKLESLANPLPLGDQEGPAGKRRLFYPERGQANYWDLANKDERIEGYNKVDYIGSYDPDVVDAPEDIKRVGNDHTPLHNAKLSPTGYYTGFFHKDYKGNYAQVGSGDYMSLAQAENQPLPLGDQEGPTKKRKLFYPERGQANYWDLANKDERIEGYNKVDYNGAHDPSVADAPEDIKRVGNDHTPLHNAKLSPTGYYNGFFHKDYKGNYAQIDSENYMGLAQAAPKPLGDVEGPAGKRKLFYPERGQKNYWDLANRDERIEGYFPVDYNSPYDPSVVDAPEDIKRVGNDHTPLHNAKLSPTGYYTGFFHKDYKGNYAQVDAEDQIRLAQAAPKPLGDVEGPAGKRKLFYPERGQKNYWDLANRDERIEGYFPVDYNSPYDPSVVDAPEDIKRVGNDHTPLHNAKLSPTGYYTGFFHKDYKGNYAQVGSEQKFDKDFHHGRIEGTDPKDYWAVEDPDVADAPEDMVKIGNGFHHLHTANFNKDGFYKGHFAKDHNGKYGDSMRKTRQPMFAQFDNDFHHGRLEGTDPKDYWAVEDPDVADAPEDMPKIGNGFHHLHTANFNRDGFYTGHFHKDHKGNYGDSMRRTRQPMFAQFDAGFDSGRLEGTDPRDSFALEDPDVVDAPEDIPRIGNGFHPLHSANYNADGFYTGHFHKDYKGRFGDSMRRQFYPKLSQFDKDFKGGRLEGTDPRDFWGIHDPDVVDAPEDIPARGNGFESKHTANWNPDGFYTGHFHKDYKGNYGNSFAIMGRSPYSSRVQYRGLGDQEGPSGPRNLFYPETKPGHPWWELSNADERLEGTRPEDYWGPFDPDVVDAPEDITPVGNDFHPLHNAKLNPEGFYTGHFHKDYKGNYAQIPRKQMPDFGDEFVQFRDNDSDDIPDNLDPIELTELNEKDYLDNHSETFNKIVQAQEEEYERQSAAQLEEQKKQEKVQNEGQQMVEISHKNPSVDYNELYDGMF